MISCICKRANHPSNIKQPPSINPQDEKMNLSDDINLQGIQRRELVFYWLLQFHWSLVPPSKSPVCPCLRMAGQFGNDCKIQIKAINQPIHVRRTVATSDMHDRPKNNLITQPTTSKVAEQEMQTKLPNSCSSIRFFQDAKQRSKFTIGLASMEGIISKMSLRIVLSKGCLEVTVYKNVAHNPNTQSNIIQQK